MDGEQLQTRIPSVLEDPGIRAIARTYSTALLDAASNVNVDELLEEFRSLINDVLDPHPRLELMLQSAIIGRDEKEAVLENSVIPHASPLFGNFIRVLAERGRLDLLRPALAEFEIEYLKRSGKKRVVVTTATPLSDEAVGNIYHRLNQLLPFDPIIDVQVDPTVLGGLVIKIGDTVYDSSLRSRVTQMRDQFRERYLHEIQSGRDRFSSAEGN